VQHHSADNGGRCNGDKLARKKSHPRIAIRKNTQHSGASWPSFLIVAAICLLIDLGTFFSASDRHGSAAASSAQARVVEIVP
jgi:hypothetical protein